MQTIAIYGKTPESKAQLLKAVKKAGFTYDEKKPDLVISYGGDGTFLWAERKYPGIPKALFRYSQICKKCHNLPIDHALALLKKGKYRVESYPKLETSVGAKKLNGTNDIVIRNTLPTHAIRFTLMINGKITEHIGDGAVIATPFGSTAYYKSITRKTFKKGIGIAFNNTTEPSAPIILPENARIQLKLTRGEAHIVADNNPDILILKEGKTIKIETSKQKARIISF